MPGTFRPRDDRGAVLMMSAVLSTVFVVVAAFAVDLGMQRVARRDMQAVADVIALDLAREIDGSTTTSVLENSAEWASALAQSKARNEKTIGTVPQVAAVLGRLDEHGDFAPTGGDEVPTAVRVTASSTVAFRFHGGEGGAVRSAVAANDANACFAIGSYAAALDTDKASLLYPLLRETLGTGLDLQAIGYGGLANVSITALDLLQVERLGVGTVDQLLDTRITLAGFYVAVADAVRDNGDTVTANLLANSLSTHIGTVLDDVRIGDLLDISQGNHAALGTTFNVFDLVTAAAFLANGGAAVAVPGLGLNLPLLGSVSGSLSLIQPPVSACGRTGTTLTTQQVTLGPLTANLSGIPAVTVPGLANVGVTTPDPVGISASLAAANGALTAISCDPEAMSVEVSSQLATAHLSVPVRVTANVSLLGIGLVDLVLPVRIDVDTAPTPVTRTADFTGPYPQKSGTGSGQSGLAGATASISLDPSWTARVALLNVKSLPLVQATVTNALPALLNSFLSSVVTPLAQSLDAVILGPLHRMLGLTVAGADVWALETDIRCNMPALRG